MLTSLPNHRQIFTPKCKQENLHIYLSHLINLKTPKKQSNLLNWSNTGQKGKLKLLMLDAEKCIWQKLYCLRLSFDYFFLDNNQTEFKIWTSHKIVLYTARKQL